MTAAPAAPAEGTMAELQSAWRMTNWRERSHASRCVRLALGRRCPRCLDLEAATNRAADAVTRARRTI